MPQFFALWGDKSRNGFFTHGPAHFLTFVVEQFKSQLRFERFNTYFYNKNFFFNC